jgi:transcription-repair coupling factor (superfamily II helicase)
VIARWAREAGPVAVITADAPDSARLREEIAWFDPGLRVHQLPDWETLPYDAFSPHQDLVSERLETLWQMSQGDYDVVTLPVTTALYRIAPPEFLAAHTFFFRRGDRIDVERFRQRLAFAGYAHVSQVVSPGEFSFRGGVIDLFPMGSALPYRIDLFDDGIETLRTFDVDTQRSIYPVQEVRLLPAREFPLDEAGITRFRQNFRAAFEGDPSRRRLYRDVSNRVTPAGIEYYLPLFFDRTATVFDYLTAEATVITHGEPGAAVEQFWRDTRGRHDLLRGDADRPLLPPAQLFLGAEDFFGALSGHPRIDLPSVAAPVVAVASPGADAGSDPAPDAAGPVASPWALPLPPLMVDRRAERPLGALLDFAAAARAAGTRVLLLAESAGRRETLAQLLSEHGVRLPQAADFAAFVAAEDAWMLGTGPLGAGFRLPAAGMAVVTESELYAQQARSRGGRGSRKASAENMLRDLSEVRIGDPVVHEQHGIGRYAGLVSLDQGEGITEFLQLDYAGGDKLYVPVAQLHLIGRYTGGPPETATLHQLGSGQWEKARRRAARKARDTAAELLNLYAQRAARRGHAFRLKPLDYEAFAEGFPFEETPDQAAAIDAVVADLTAGRPMDRLVCGDVGFGKTEVALRAAFVAVSEGRQVAVLVPTTLLAEQHLQTFSDRFADWPVRIAELSRFRSAKEQAAALAGLASGQVDIVIGTHRLVQPDVRFRDLGLVIIDEEHRFGVRHKERLKSLRAEVDVLTLTATPIPRSLAMSLEGLRDFSVIATAPEKRLAIRTFVSRRSDGLIREACQRELRRGGQIYFVHNDIGTIERERERLEALLPEARVRVAHGQMRERELEYVMRDFHQQRFNLLLCTTIIETGIDVPQANTIVIDRADRFGLAQLHQLRGRVGRSHHQAYAYLLTDDEAPVSTDARKRLEAIQMMEELGSGFYLAMHDLEIRGAGEVLGENQSGEMQEVGFGMYNEMLAQAVKSLRAGREPDLDAPLAATTEINLHESALLPEDYCADVHERLVIYKRLANCDTEPALEALAEELVDRFGVLPDPARLLVDTHRLRILSRPLGVARIDAGVTAVQLQFGPAANVDPQRVIALVRSRAGHRLVGSDRLRIEAPTGSTAERVALLRRTLEALSGPTPPPVASAADPSAPRPTARPGSRLPAPGATAADPSVPDRSPPAASGAKRPGGTASPGAGSTTAATSAARHAASRLKRGVRP